MCGGLYGFVHSGVGRCITLCCGVPLFAMLWCVGCKKESAPGLNDSERCSHLWCCGTLMYNVVCTLYTVSFTVHSVQTIRSGAVTCGVVEQLLAVILARQWN